MLTQEAQRLLCARLVNNCSISATSYETPDTLVYYFDRFQFRKWVVLPIATTPRAPPCCRPGEQTIGFFNSCFQQVGKECEMRGCGEMKLYGCCCDPCSAQRRREGGRRLQTKSFNSSPTA